MLPKWSLVAALSFLACLTGVAQAQFFRAGPNIKEISAQDLHRLLNDRAQEISAAQQQGLEPPRATFLVVDVREPQESQVSMIPGAITKAQYEKQAASYGGMTIIPYCTVGGRSLQYAKHLASSGTKVLNFNESIIGWCNARLPLVTPSGKATNVVHTYNARNRVPSNYKAVY